MLMRFDYDFTRIAILTGFHVGFVVGFGHEFTGLGPSWGKDEPVHTRMETNLDLNPKHSAHQNMEVATNS